MSLKEPARVVSTTCRRPIRSSMLLHCLAWPALSESILPAWGAIFTGRELQALLDYLWTFQFPQEET